MLIITKYLLFRQNIHVLLGGGFVCSAVQLVESLSNGSHLSVFTYLIPGESWISWPSVLLELVVGQSM